LLISPSSDNRRRYSITAHSSLSRYFDKKRLLSDKTEKQRAKGLRAVLEFLMLTCTVMSGNQTDLRRLSDKKYNECWVIRLLRCTELNSADNTRTVTLNACYSEITWNADLMQEGHFIDISLARYVPGTYAAESHCTIRNVNTTYAAALKTTTHPKTRCTKPHAATQHLMLLMMGVCTRNMLK